MVLYARSDVASVSVPVSSGGCGTAHIRPVVNGSPAKQFILNCPQCETFLKQDIIAADYKQIHLGNGSREDIKKRWPGLWGHTPDTVPSSYDEENEQAKLEAQNARDSANANKDALNTIAEAMAGNQELMRRLMELAAQPEPEKTPVKGSWSERACESCGTPITRAKGQRGALPHKCAGCKKAA